MGKRLYRILQKDILSKINSLKDIELNVILSNNTTYLGYIVDSGQDYIRLKDTRNKILQFSISEIVEIIYDKEAAY